MHIFISAPFYKIVAFGVGLWNLHFQQETQMFITCDKSWKMIHSLVIIFQGKLSIAWFKYN
jgi:hypothetical protein